MKMIQAASYLICAAVAFKYSFDIVGTEFGSGMVTGPLLTSHVNGSILFILASILIFIYRRAASISAMLASLLCLPLYLYFVAPGLFQEIFAGLYSVPPQTI